MIYNQTHILIVYIVVITMLIGLIGFTNFVNVGDFLHNYHPKGTIAAYYGTSAPDGWMICDGNYNERGISIKVNGMTIPDLRGKFVYGGTGFSQLVFNNSYVTPYQKLFVNYTVQIEGGKNFQTLSNRVKIVDKFMDMRPKSFRNVEMNDVINDNKNIKNTMSGMNTSMGIFYEKVYTQEANKMEEILNISDQFNKIDNNMVVPTEKQTDFTASKTEIDTAINDFDFDNVQETIEGIKLTNAKLENSRKLIKEIKISNFNDPNIASGASDDEIIDKEYATEVIIGPDFDGYKYPTHKTLNADLNLPPFYSLIFIIKT